MQCKFCPNEIEEGKEGYLIYLDDAEFSRLQELKLSKGENLCLDCKKEVGYANLAPLLV